MKTWNVPQMEELSLAMTASGAVMSTTENTIAGNVEGEWVESTCVPEAVISVTVDGTEAATVDCDLSYSVIS